MLDLLYFLSFIVPIPFWLLLIVSPHREYTKRILSSHGAFLLLGAMYLFLIVGAAVSGIGKGSLNISTPELLGMFISSPTMALVIWVHIVTVDLAAGYYVWGECERLGLPIYQMRGFLIITALLAPLGIFIFSLWRLLTQAAREARVSETNAVVPQNTNSAMS